MIRTTHFLVLASVLAAPLAAWAQADTGGACWNRDVERLDYYENPPEGGDSTFFSGSISMGAKTNVTLAFFAKTSLGELPYKLYQLRNNMGGPPEPPGGAYLAADGGVMVSGCSNTYLNSRPYFIPTNTTPPSPASKGLSGLGGFYSAGNTYPDPQITYTVGGAADNLSTSSYYRFLNWPVGPSGNTVGGVAPTAETALNACTSAVIAEGGAAGSPYITDCTQCVQNSGYWFNPLASMNDITQNAGVFSGNWLRFYPIKYEILALAYERLANGPLLTTLREAVLGNASSGAGSYLIQKMLPQSCTGTGRPNHQIGAVNDTGLIYSNTYNPISEVLLNMAWYQLGQQTPYGAPSDPSLGAGTYPSGWKSTKSNPCGSCSGDFLVLFSDGRGDQGNPYCAPLADGGLPAPCHSANQCASVAIGSVGAGMGTENDGNDFFSKVPAGGVAPLVSDPNICADDYAPSVANWMANNTLSSGAGASALTDTVRTYVIGIGPDTSADYYHYMSVLPLIASNGKGKYLAADDFATLENGITKILTQIVQSSTSFSSSAISTVQSQQYTSAFIPRFIPTYTPQWKGALSRYNLLNEFAAGCTASDYGVASYPRNPNGNSGCYDVYLTQADGGIVQEINGTFAQVNWQGGWDGGSFPAITYPDGGAVPAEPFWEASKVLTQRVNKAIAAGNGGAGRNIWTVVNGSMVAFNESNVSTLVGPLALGGYQGTFCAQLSAASQHVYSSDSDCAKDVIDFMQGEDVMWQNPYNLGDGGGIPNPLHARPDILGDIFHSTPILVTPPVPEFLCDLGVENQCVPSLYNSQLEQSSGVDGGAAYDAYMSAYQTRNQVVLVGANDGMLHAFQAGAYVDAGVYDMGTGDELWAFISPDLLPKLQRYIINDRHELMVDGTPMVRDIWVDGSGGQPNDNLKEPKEFHTVAITGEREGGRHFFALDITDATAAGTHPTFLWMAPTPGNIDDLAGGESWDDLGPGAPPIGPIAEADSASPLILGSTGKHYHERYVVAVGGGYDPAFIRGRGFYLLDAWTGADLFRFTRQDGSPALTSKLFPVAAPVSMLDTNGDGIFDSAIFGDLGGQLWAVDLYYPGGASGGSSPPYTNWTVGRSFVQFGTAGTDFSNRSPFFQRPAAALMPDNSVRAYLGSGDRDHIKEVDGGYCGIANLSACVRKQCSVSVGTQQYGIGGNSVVDSWSYVKGNTTPTDSYSAGTGSYDCNSAVAADSTYPASGLGLTFNITCPVTDAGVYESDLYCNNWSDDGGAECPIASGRPVGTLIDSSSGITVQNSYFYSVKVFDPVGSATNRTLAELGASPSTYDSNNLTEGSLANVTDGGSTTSTSNGYYIIHSNTSDEKTASSALILGGCVLWNTLQPSVGGSFSCGSMSLPPDTAYLYQADAISGAIQCGLPGSATQLATQRYVGRPVTVAPQQPAMVVSVNSATGQVAYGGVSIDPGAAPASANVGTSNLVGIIHWLEVPRRVHECRHQGINCN